MNFSNLTPFTKLTKVELAHWTIAHRSTKCQIDIRRSAAFTHCVILSREEPTHRKQQQRGWCQSQQRTISEINEVRIHFDLTRGRRVGSEWAPTDHFRGRDTRPSSRRQQRAASDQTRLTCLGAVIDAGSIVIVFVVVVIVVHLHVYNAPKRSAVAEKSKINRWKTGIDIELRFVTAQSFPRALIQCESRLFVVVVINITIVCVLACSLYPAVYLLSCTNIPVTADLFIVVECRPRDTASAWLDTFFAR